MDLDIEISQVTTLKSPTTSNPPTTPVHQADSPSPAVTLTSTSNMQVLEVMVPALATRSTDAVIEDLRRRGLHPGAPTVDNEPLTECVQNVSKIPEEDGVIEDEDGADESESDDESPAQPSDKQELSYEKSVRDSYIRSRVFQATKGPTAPENKGDDKQSVKWLIKDSGSQEIISSPREYQIELFEKAKTQNTIAVLDTGSGKTLIAALLLRHVIDEELERRANGGDKRIAFFLVDSVALVFQQYAVLKCNLNHKMEQFCGDMGCDLWSKELWEKHFNENMVIVCTAEVLFQCLHHSFITMKQINLLIFDEAHHAKRNHAYARIIKDFYASEPDQSLLPRIFGMTASPVDARTNIKKGAAELEALLHSQIATASDASLLQYTNKKTKEEVAYYDALPPSTESQLFKMVNQLVGGIKECSKPLEYAVTASSDLGSWVADRVLLISFTGEDVKRLEAKIESNFHKQAQINPIPLSNLENRKEKLRSAEQIILAHVFAPPQLSRSQLSSKVLALASKLRERFERTTFDKCIVFVKQRYTAKLLADLFASPQIGTPHLRVGSLVRYPHS
jgi:endoribonuclease Dicer